MDKRQLVLVAIFAAGLFAVQSLFKSSPPAAQPVVAAAPVQWNLEQRYVLQNPVQQVVLSNLGGSIAEVNLALRTGSDSASVVKTVGADGQIARLSPLNDRFPLRSAKIFNGKTGAVVAAESQLGGFYPLLRRGLVGPGEDQAGLLRPEWYAMSLSSPEGSLTQPFEVKRFSSNEIRFEWSDGDKRIAKTYSINQPPLRDPYLLRVRIETAGDVGPLWVSSGVPEAELVGGSPEPMLQYAMNTSGKVEALKLDLPKDQSLLSSVYPGWVASSNGFFSLILNPATEVGPGFKAQRVPAEKALSRLLLLPEQQGWFGRNESGQPWPADPGERWAGYRMLLPLGSKPGKTDLALFAGPLDESVLATVDQTLTQERDGQNPDFSAAKTFYGFFSFVSAPFAKFMWWLMQAFYALTSNWVASLFLLTVALRAMTWPLNAWSTRGMAKMRALQPKVQELERMFANNPQGLRLAQAQLYREHGFNPLAPLLPQLVQIPFLIGMLDLLRQAFPLRGASFIPGWIPNLAAPDTIFSWGVSLPLIGTGLHLLPILLAGLTWWQSRLTTAPSQPSGSGADLSDQQKQRAMTGKILPLLFLFLFYSAPSGLNLYWLFSTLLGILQQKLANRRQEASSSSAKVVPFNNR
jgi:YidC/Oxa1 family membrane protein insertase